jgi:hypothetical protein
MTTRDWLPAVLAVFLAIFVAKAFAGEKTDSPALQLEANIPLGDIRGRIDHMAVDLKRGRLFVAALGNGSLADVDLQTQRLERRIDGLPEPQGVGYDPVTDILYVANAGDGSVRLFTGTDLSPAGRIELGSDADNIRVRRARVRGTRRWGISCNRRRYSRKNRERAVKGPSRKFSTR